MYVTAYFADQGSPKTGLSPTIDIYDLSDNSLLVDDGNMGEVGGGFYKYDFTDYSSAEDYAIVCDGGSGLSGANRYSTGGHGPKDIVFAFFLSAAVPATGLSPTIDIYELSDDSKIVDASAMTEVGGGFYSYDFTDYDAREDYVLICDGGNTLDGWERYSLGISVQEAIILIESIDTITALFDGKIGIDLEIESGGDLVAETVTIAGGGTHDIMIESVLSDGLYNVMVQEVNRINVDIGVI